MLLSLGLWAIVSCLSIVVAIWIISKPDYLNLGRIIIILMCVLVIISPLYMEYPGTSKYSIAVVSKGGDKVEFRKFILCEYLVDGKIIRIPYTDVELSFLVRAKNVNSVPYIEIGRAHIFYKIVNYKKYVSHREWIDNRWEFTNLLIDLTIKKQTEETKRLFLQNKLEVTNGIKENIEKSELQSKRLKKFLQKELDVLNCGVEITRIII